MLHGVMSCFTWIVSHLICFCPCHLCPGLAGITLFCVPRVGLWGPLYNNIEETLLHESGFQIQSRFILSFSIGMHVHGWPRTYVWITEHVRH